MSANPKQESTGLLMAALEIAGRRKDTQVRLKQIIRARVNWDEADRLITELIPDEDVTLRVTFPALVKGK